MEQPQTPDQLRSAFQELQVKYQKLQQAHEDLKHECQVLRQLLKQ